ncbi:MAG: LysR family transcriptional regulator [Burkholderiaceae bacterium]
MPSRRNLQRLDLYLFKVLDTLLREQSVTRTARIMQTSQPAISESLRRLRAITGDELFVRHGQRMVATDFGRSLVAPMADILRIADESFLAERRFDPATTTATFRVAAPDYLDPRFLPRVIHALRRQAPGARIEVRTLSAEFDYETELANGVIDVAIGNWLEVPADLHRGVLIDDEVVCLVACDHPAVRRGWSVEQWLQADHLAPALMVASGPGVIDEHLTRRGLTRNIVARGPHFGMVPATVADSSLVLTTGRLFCEQHLDERLAIVACPLPFPRLTYFQLWHRRGHHNPAQRWLRALVQRIALGLGQGQSRSAGHDTGGPH